ncbi:MAG TPA: VWA domain-containing protein [Bryobacteraceae bacterium]|nr:VWA domain-containing protein [Bryobacteraceae bacterium]
MAPATVARGQSEPSAGTAVIRSSVREVLLDVVVRDKHGKPVKNLAPGQIEVYEDGVRQNVRSFRLVSGSEVRAEDEKEAAEAKAPAPKTGATPPSARPKLNPLRTVNLVCIVFGNQSPETRDTALRAAEEFVDNELRPNTFIGVFAFDEGGMRPVYPFSNNREHLRKALELAATNQLRPMFGSTAMTVGAAVSSAEMTAMLNAGGPNSPPVSTDTLARQIVNSSGQAASGVAADDASIASPLGPRGAMGLDAMQGMHEIDSLLSLTKQLSPLPFQKTVLLLSGGLTRPADQLGYWHTLIQTAVKGGVTFYALDTWGLGVCQGESDADCLSSATAVQPAVDVLNKAARLSQRQRLTGLSAKENMELMHQDDYVNYSVLSANKQAAMRDLAESTGGFLIANTNNTSQLMKHVMEDVDTHYEVTYEPAQASYDGRFRKIEVKLTHPDWQARTRSGYYSLPESPGNTLGAGDMAALKALGMNPPPRAFDYQARALRFPSNDGISQYAVVFNVPIASLTATPKPEQKAYRFHVSLLAVAKDASGQVTDWFSCDVPSNVGNQYMPAIERRQMTYERSFHLPPGRYTIETAVVDEEGDRVSTSVLPVESSAASGPDMSDVMLAQDVKDLSRAGDGSDPFEVEGHRVIPLARTALPAGWSPYLYFVLYPRDGGSKTRLDIRLLRDGRQIKRWTKPVDEPDATGAVPMLISAVQSPGNYEARVAMSQGGATVERSLTYSIAGN